jgi:RimJ/RimL family protein N-acetyltransferase
VQLNRSEVAHDAAFPVIRPIQPADGSGLQQFIRGLSLASRYSRFMVAIRELPDDMLDRFVNPQPGREAALVASSPSAGIVGLAQFVADDAGDGCEVAIVVDDAWHRQGLGTDLLTVLMLVARGNGIEQLHADMFADNHAMCALAHKLGCEVRTNAQAPYLVQISRTLESPYTASEEQLVHHAAARMSAYAHA